jgi:WD40 repeat protein
MTKSVIINLGSGDLYKGFPRVTVQLWTAGNSRPQQFIGTLPAAPNLVELYRNWQLVYRGLCGRLAGGQREHFLPPIINLSTNLPLMVGQLEISATGITNVSQVNFDDLCQQLQASINSWLMSEGFLPIEYQLRSQLDAADLIRVIIETNDLELRYLPWHRWAFFADYPQAEMALSQPEYQYRDTLKTTKIRQKVRILAVLENSSGIDLAAETILLQRLQDAEVKFLLSPSRPEFNNQLWQPEGWDILFFAGHSQTQEETGRIYINENITGNSLTICQLAEALKTAIENGLALAIFNSCDGLGLAQALEKLHIPTVIVMREPIPNLVAQEFFQQFLSSFAIDQLPLYLAVQQARRKLQGLENDFPAASWLPVICQNPAVEPPTWSQLGGIPPCPYQGLFAFGESDARFFFGREQVTQTLLQAVKQKPLVAVIGASGSGKSSVVFAGLVPLLRQQLCSKDQPPYIVSFRPGNSPFTSLATGLMQCVPIARFISARFPPQADRSITDELEQQLRQNQQGLAQLIQGLAGQDTAMQLILIADQFEELYTLCPEADRQAFLDNMLQAINCVQSFTMVLTLRADFCGHALAYRPWSDALQEAIQILGPMNHAELQAAIAQPAAKMQVQLEGGLIQKLISAMDEQPGRLPLLEFALTQLWSNQQQGLLTHQTYDEIGGVEAALANHAELVYAKLNAADRVRAQRLFIQLVQPGTGTEDNRRLAIKDDIRSENWDLVTHLASSRLVVTNRHQSSGEETVELVHEALIRSWKRLRQWMQIDGEFRLWQEQLRTNKRQWEESNCDQEMVLRGKALADADYWQHQRREELSLGEQIFVCQSLALRDRQIKYHKRRQQLTIMVLTGGLLITLGLVALIKWQGQQSNIREIEALSKSSEALFATNNKLEALVEAIRAKRTLKMLGNSSPATAGIVNLALNQATYGLVEYNRFSAHTDGVRRVSFSPDGKTIASIPENGIVKLWNANGVLKTTITGDGATINDVSFSPNSQTIALASNNKTIQIWSINGSLKKTIIGHSAGVTSISFSPNGQIIASASNDKTIKIWDINGNLKKTIVGHSAGVTNISFSPDSQFIASASNDKTIKIWDISGNLKKTISGHSAEINSVSFSPDGQTIASASNDKTIKTWDINGNPKKTISGHSAEVNSVSFSPDGQIMASSSADKTVKIWDSNGTLLSTLEGHGDIVWAVKFSPDGQTIASASWDSTVRLWHYRNPLLITLSGHIAGASVVSFSPDGKTIASASDDQTVRLWNPDGTLLKTFNGHRGRVYDVAFSPDGKTVASAAADQTVRLWNLDGTLLKSLTGHGAAVWGVAFSPNGKTISSASDDQTVKLWNLDGTLLKTLTGHQGTVFKTIFSLDGQTVISVSSDQTIKIWNITGVLLKTIKAHKEAIPGVAVSFDGKMIASSSNDKTIKFWDLDGNLLKTIQAHNKTVQDVAFSPNGKTLSSVSADHTVKIWNLDGTLLKTLKRHGDAIWGVNYSPNGQVVASASADKTVILWNLKKLLELDELTYACKQIQDYLLNNAEVPESDRTLCKQD